MAKLITAITLANAVANGKQALKFRQIKLKCGQYRYEVKGLTEADYAVFDIGGEDLTEAEREAMLEEGGWTILDSFSASAVVQVYNAISAELRYKFNELSMKTLIGFAFKYCK